MEFNKVIKAKDIEVLRRYEEDYPVIGIARYREPEEGISTLSIIATITDILCDERLAFELNENCYLTKVRWYQDNSRKIEE